MYRCKANKLWNLKLTINFASFILVGKHKPLNAKISSLCFTADTQTEWTISLRR